ncbi:MAG: helix-turn-helix transcriptional regulator [Bacteroidota bacterium]|nr:helix-turn-helix transcriptional regulator [Bacteroidota bacterium]
MKEKEGYVDCPKQQLILYVEKEDGKYGPMQTGSYITRNYLDDFESKQKSLEESLRHQVINGEISPVHYFMVMEDLTISELASRVKLRKAKVRKHLLPGYFKEISAEILNSYAEVFNIQVNDLLELTHIPGHSAGEKEINE